MTYNAYSTLKSIKQKLALSKSHDEVLEHDDNLVNDDDGAYFLLADNEQTPEKKKKDFSWLKSNKDKQGCLFKKSEGYQKIDSYENRTFSF